MLKDYKHLVVPHNSLYDLGENSALESAVKKIVRHGGNVFHGPHCELAKRALGVKEEAVASECIAWDEEIIPHGWSTVSFKGGKALGKYIQSGKTALVIVNHRSSPVDIGSIKSKKEIPQVPSARGWL